MSIGDNIKKCRNQIGISQRELGRRISKSGQLISALEADEANPSLHTLRSISEVLGVKAEELMEEVDGNQGASIGENIKRFRKQKDLKQIELAAKLEMPDSTLANYERNHREPSLGALMRIADTLNVSIGELITGEDKCNVEKPKTLADYSLEDLLREIRRRIE